MIFLIVAMVNIVFFYFATSCFAEWTPLVTSAMFDGLHADVMTTGSSLLIVALTIAAFGLIFSIIARR